MIDFLKKKELLNSMYYCKLKELLKPCPPSFFIINNRINFKEVPAE